MPSSYLNNPARSGRAQDNAAVAMFGIVLLGFALRAALLSANRFHPDESLYASFALKIADARDVWLSHEVVDKSPLAFYLGAAALNMLGAKARYNIFMSELALRLPALAASTVSIALAAACARKLHSAQAGLFAGLLLALSPLAISFGATLFMDALLSCALLASLLLVLRGHWAWSGCAFAAAYACKQSALVFAPLVLTLGVLVQLAAPGPNSRGQHLRNWITPLLVVLAAVYFWDYVRAAPIGFWAQGYADNMPGRFIRPAELLPRWQQLAGLGAAVTGAPALNALLLAYCIWLPLSSMRSNPQPLQTTISMVILGFIVAYLAGHWLLAFNLYDRYLVPLAPLIIILLAQPLAAAAGLLQGYGPARVMRAVAVAGTAVLLTLLPASLRASASGYALGGDHGAYDGIEKVAAALRSAPTGSVLYDQWLDWQWKFYLDHSPAYIGWVQGPQNLAADLRAFGASSPRYFVAPSWEPMAEMRSAITGAGFVCVPLLDTVRRDGSRSFTLYQLVAD